MSKPWWSITDPINPSIPEAPFAYSTSGGTTAIPRPAKPRCEDIGFEHYWEYDNRLYLLACDPPQARRRRCKNCDRIEKQVTEWRVVQDAEPTR